MNGRTKTPEDLSLVRKRIDALDDELLELLNQRAKLALEAGGLKKAAGLKSLDAARESEIIQRLLLKSAGSPLPQEAVKDIFETIIQACRKIQAE